jgi:hypothetical protein
VQRYMYNLAPSEALLRSQTEWDRMEVLCMYVATRTCRIMERVASDSAGEIGKANERLVLFELVKLVCTSYKLTRTAMEDFLIIP